jgi:hypothetical protein
MQTAGSKSETCDCPISEPPLEHRCFNRDEHVGLRTAMLQASAGVFSHQITCE